MFRLAQPSRTFTNPTLGTSRRDRSDSRTIGLFKLTDDWGEGTTGSGGSIGGTGQGFPANAGDATTASASSTVGSVIDDPYTWMSTAALISDVQGWLDTPASNFGWELINLDEATPTDFRAFYTRDFSDVLLRPQLQVTFTPPTTVPEPGSTVLVLIGTLILALTAYRRFHPVIRHGCRIT